MNQPPTTPFKYPSLKGEGASDEIQHVQYVPYYAVHPPSNNSTTTQSPHQPNLYPWSGINQIPFNFSSSASVVHNDVELQVPITQNLIPSTSPSNNNITPTHNSAIPSQTQQETTPAVASGRPSFFWRWRNCKHSQQRRFLKSLKSKTWTRIPRAVGVFSLLFVILSIAFFLTIGKSADNNFLNYRKGMCQINTDQDNSIVHFDYERGVYFLELNVSVVHRSLGPGGPGHDDFHPHGHHGEPSHHNRQTREIREMRHGPDSYAGRPPTGSKPKRSFIMSRVCSFALQQQTSDCRDRVIKQGEISCFIDEERMRLIEMMDMFLHFDEQERSKKGEQPPRDSGKQQQPPRGEKKSLEEQGHAKPQPDNKSQDSARIIEDKHLENIVATRETVGRSFRRSLRCSIPAFLIVSVIAVAIFIAIGFKVLDGKSRRSFDRFIRQYFDNPFRGSGEVYKLDEVSSSAVVIQDPKEPKFRTLLSSSTLKMENTPRQETILQKRLSKFWKLMRSTATKASETLLLYEKPSKQNISCHGKRNGACHGKRKFGHILRVVAKVAFILLVVGLIAYGTIHAGVSIFELKIFSGFLHIYFTLFVIAILAWFALFKRRSVHYLVTSDRIVKVVELPIRLRMNLISVNFDKIKGVWAEDNRIYLKTVNSKGMEKSGVIFEHVIDPTFVVNLIKQQIANNNQTETTDPSTTATISTTEQQQTTTETH